MRMPIFSILTVTHNRADVISDCVKSVLSQNFQDFEHVILDGASSDDTLTILSRIDDRRISVISETDAGIYDALNKGIKRARGSIIGILHSDDVYADPQVLERVHKLFSESDADLVYGDLDYVSARNMSKIVRRWKSGYFDAQSLKQGWMPPHPTVFVKASVFDDFGLYDPQFKIAADYELMLRLFSNGRLKIAYLPEVLVRMRLGGVSNRSLKQIMTKSREDYIALKRYHIGGYTSLLMKNISKVSQFFVR
jgi:glycosyltransferase